MSGTDGLFGRFLSIFSTKVLATLVAFVSTPVIVRLLGPGGYGDYAAFLSVFSLYMIPVSAGITEGIQKFVAEQRDLPHWRERVVRFYAVLAVGVVSVAVVALVAFTALGGARAVFGAEFSQYFYVMALLVLAAQFRALTYRTVLGFGMETISEPLKLAKKVITVGVGIALVLAGYGVTGMLVGHVLASLFVACVAIAVIARQLSLGAVFTGAEGSFPHRELLSFNALNIVLVLLVMSLFHVDIVMLRTLTDGATTGYYKAALALAEYLWIVPIALQRLLLHSSSTLWSDERHERITALAARVTRYTVLLVVLLAIGLGTLADRFIPLYYGSGFGVAVLPLLVLLPGAVGFAAARPLQAISQGSGQIKTLVVAVGGAAALNLALNAALIPQLGMVGAAVATSVGYASMFGFLVWTAWRVGYDPLDDFRGVRIAATALLAAPVVVASDQLIGHDLLALLLVPPIGLAVYSLAALLTGAIDTEEIVEILDRIPGLGAVAAASRSLVSDR